MTIDEFVDIYLEEDTVMMSVDHPFSLLGSIFCVVLASAVASVGSALAKPLGYAEGEEPEHKRSGFIRAGAVGLAGLIAAVAGGTALGMPVNNDYDQNQDNYGNLDVSTLDMQALGNGGQSMTVQDAHAGGFHQYLVTNTSPADSAYEMDDFTLWFGSTDGVYDALGPDNWLFEIDTDRTHFWGEGGKISPDGGQGVFELYSTITDIRDGEATAYTRLDETFPPVDVQGPGTETGIIPEPSSIALLAVGLTALVGPLVYRNKIGNNYKTDKAA